MAEPAQNQDRPDSLPVKRAHLVRRRLGICVDGYPFILTGLAVTLLVRYFGGATPSLPFLLVTLWMIWFFRDPERELPEGENRIVSPADGKIIGIREMEDPYFGEGSFVRISVFMNIFNVHVNRIPLAGKVTGLKYKQGRYFAAYEEKASEANEQMAICLETSFGKMVFTQIAGLVARRIICRLEEEQEVSRGQRFGLIRFGSRVDLYLPKSASVKVEMGEKVYAGRTVLGEIS